MMSDNALTGNGIPLANLRNSLAFSGSVAVYHADAQGRTRCKGDMPGPLFFDLDGTLTDPARGIVASIWYALDQLGVERPPAEELTKYIGPPLAESMATLVGESRADDALHHYRARYAETGWRENAVYAGIDDMLARLRGSGFELYVATSKVQVFATRILSHFELDGYFSGVFGAELDGRRADKSDLLRFALATTGTSTDAVMIGDRRYDVAGARSNGMRSVGVTWGFGSRDELIEAGADALVDAPQDIAAVVG